MVGLSTQLEICGGLDGIIITAHADTQVRSWDSGKLLGILINMKTLVGENPQTSNP